MDIFILCTINQFFFLLFRFYFLSSFNSHIFHMFFFHILQLCMSEEYLVLYRDKLQSEGYGQHNSNNKLRDSEEKFTEEGHCFSFNSDMMFSYDICGSCEAHAMLLSVELGLVESVEDAPTLKGLDKKYTQNNPNFAKCPRFP